MNPTRELHAKSVQTLQSKKSLPKQTQQQANHKHKQGNIQMILYLNSLLYHRVLLITFIHVQVWLHLTKVTQDLLHVCVLPKRKIRYALGRITNSIHEIASKQTIRHGWKGKGFKNYQEDTSKGDHASNYRLKPTRRRGYRYQDRNSEDELRSGDR